jgi:hypothetical protein
MSTAPTTMLRYRIGLGLLSVVFIASVLLTVFDAAGTYEETARLGFPIWIVWPQTLAKALGVLAILFSRSRSLRDFAYAGFLFDLLLATGAHIAHGDGFVVVALISLAIWTFAFVTELQQRRRNEAA